jgi:hypothetical protein
MERIPVYITNASQWWVVWLPVLGSFVVALAALVIGLMANRTNREAIKSADGRERERWRLDEVTKVSTDILRRSHDARALITEIIKTRKDYGPLEQAQIAGMVPSSSDYANECDRLRSSIAPLVFSGGAEANDAAENLAASHRVVHNAILAFESMVSGNYNGGWTTEDGSTDPDSLLKSFLRAINLDAESVVASERDYAQTIRRDLGISEPVTNVQRTESHSAASQPPAGSL